jgi:hypothetical protein
VFRRRGTNPCRGGNLITGDLCGRLQIVVPRRDSHGIDRVRSAMSTTRPLTISGFVVDKLVLASGAAVAL